MAEHSLIHGVDREHAIVVVTETSGKVSAYRLDRNTGHRWPLRIGNDKLAEAIHSIVRDMAGSKDFTLLVAKGDQVPLLLKKVVNEYLIEEPPGGTGPCGGDAGDPSPKGVIANLPAAVSLSAGTFGFDVWAQSCLRDEPVINLFYTVSATGNVTLNLGDGSTGGNPLAFSPAMNSVGPRTGTAPAKNQPTHITATFDPNQAPFQTQITLVVTGTIAHASADPGYRPENRQDAPVSVG
jgi:hypothetical protein